MMKEFRKPSLLIALIPVLFLIIFLTVNVLVFGDETLNGSNQIILLLAASLTSLLAFYYGIRWGKISDLIIRSISKAMPAVLILLLIGSLAGTWLLSGVVPAMIFYGLKIIHPKVFHVCNNYWVVRKIGTSQVWKIIEENKLHSIYSDVD